MANRAMVMSQFNIKGEYDTRLGFGTVKVKSATPGGSIGLEWEPDENDPRGKFSVDIRLSLEELQGILDEAKAKWLSAVASGTHVVGG